MPRRFFRKWTPSRERIHSQRFLRIFGALLHQQDLWHLNRDSVARAFAIGIFWAAIPMPFQMIPAAACAILFRGNIALSVALVWLTNPITMPAVFYTEYVLGTWILGTHIHFEDFSISWEWIRNNMGLLWKPLYLGALVTGIFGSAFSYFTIRGLWRWNIVRKLKARRVIRRRYRRSHPASPKLPKGHLRHAE